MNKIEYFVLDPKENNKKIPKGFFMCIKCMKNASYFSICPLCNKTEGATQIDRPSIKKKILGSDTGIIIGEYNFILPKNFLLSLHIHFDSVIRHIMNSLPKELKKYFALRLYNYIELAKNSEKEKKANYFGKILSLNMEKYEAIKHSCWIEMNKEKKANEKNKN